MTNIGFMLNAQGQLFDTLNFHLTGTKISYSTLRPPDLLVLFIEQIAEAIASPYSYNQRTLPQISVKSVLIIYHTRMFTI